MVIKENINIGSYVRQTYKKNINNIIVKKVGGSKITASFRTKICTTFCTANQSTKTNLKN